MKQSYQKTSIGVMPADWSVARLGDLIQPGRSIRYGIVQPGRYDPHGRFMVRGQDYSGVWASPSDMFRVSPMVEERYANARLLSGDILITIVGASTGRIAVVPQWLEGANLTQTTARVAIDDTKASRHYCAQVLSSWYGLREVRNYIKGGAQPGLNCGDVEKFLIPLPSSQVEQEAIAGVLENVDRLIRELGCLIAKKRGLRAATAQRLLSGEYRLPGFSGSWTTTPLGGLLRVRHGKSQRGVEAADGPFPILATGGVIGRANQALYSRPSVLIGRKGTIDAPQYMDTPFWSIDTLFFTEVSPASDPKFIFNLFQRIPWLSYNEASGVPSLNAKTIEAIEVTVPECAPEQREIAFVLSSMDVDLLTLEGRLRKTQDLKVAITQALLSGRTRLA